MSRVERVAAHVGQIHALLQCIINECDAAQTEVFDYLYMSDAANEQSEKIKAKNAKLRELCNDMWSVMSCEYASDAMADACHYVLDCDMDEVDRRVNELCKEES